MVIPLLLIAPIVGFCVRCAVDYIQERIHKEVRARQAELEIYYSRHRPRVNRWQGILDEDREEAADYTEAAAASDTLVCAIIATWSTSKLSLRFVSGIL